MIYLSLIPKFCVKAMCGHPTRCAIQESAPIHLSSSTSLASVDGRSRTRAMLRSTSSALGGSPCTGRLPGRLETIHGLILEMKSAGTHHFYMCLPCESSGTHNVYMPLPLHVGLMVNVPILFWERRRQKHLVTSTNCLRLWD